MADSIQIPRCFFNKQNKYSLCEPREDIIEWSDKRIKQLMINKDVFNESLGGLLQSGGYYLYKVFPEIVLIY